jgi:hypothetical protein
VDVVALRAAAELQPGNQITLVVVLLLIWFEVDASSGPADMEGEVVDRPEQPITNAHLLLQFLGLLDEVDYIKRGQLDDQIR